MCSWSEVVGGGGGGENVPFGSSWYPMPHSNIIQGTCMGFLVLGENAVTLWLQVIRSSASIPATTNVVDQDLSAPAKIYSCRSSTYTAPSFSYVSNLAFAWQLFVQNCWSSTASTWAAWFCLIASILAAAPRLYQYQLPSRVLDSSNPSQHSLLSLRFVGTVQRSRVTSPIPRTSHIRYTYTQTHMLTILM